MHLLLTDRLCCPRCGPGFGLILRADRLESRRVLEGVLGCPNCRDSFHVTGGFADLRAPPRRPLGAGLAGPPSGTDQVEDVHVDRLVALLGIIGGPGTVAMVGEPARLAPAVATRLPELTVAAVDADLGAWPEIHGVSRLVAGPGLPFFDASLRGAVIDGRLGAPWIAEAARTVHARGRVVVQHAPAGTVETLRAGGLVVLAEEAETVVAARG